MGKLILLSFLVVSIAWPALCARHGDALRGMRRTLFGLAVFVVAYWVGVQLFTPSV